MRIPLRKLQRSAVIFVGGDQVLTGVITGYRCLILSAEFLFPALHGSVKSGHFYGKP